VRKHNDFKNQEIIVTSIVRNLCGAGGLPIGIVERQWFRQFMKDTEPKFHSVSRVTVKRKLNELYQQERSSLLQEVHVLCKPTVTLDFWTGRDGRSFMGCTVHYINLKEKKMKNAMLFFREVPPPYMSENVRIKFEDELDRCGVCCFQVVTDNAANMKSAFQVTEYEDELDDQLLSEDEDEMCSDEDRNSHDEDAANEIDLTYWSPQLLHFEGWIGCAAHQLQLVVHDGYKELNNYRRIQAAISKCKAISKLSQQSSHFKYALTSRIPVPNDTRWNSRFKLHQHILNHLEEINEALDNENRSSLCLSTADKDILSKIVEVMNYFSEATNILQAERKPTISQVIPVIDSLENALKSINKDTASINALCESLTNSLEKRFSYLLDSSVHLAATALDPTIKLSFTDNNKPGKKFTVDSSIVKRKLQQMLPETEDNVLLVSSEPEPSKKRRLLDFSSVSLDCSTCTSSSGLNIELQSYFDQPQIKVA
jgi:hypothetical protein